MRQLYLFRTDKLCVLTSRDKSKNDSDAKDHTPAEGGNTPPELPRDVRNTVGGYSSANVDTAIADAADGCRTAESSKSAG